MVSKDLKKGLEKMSSPPYMTDTQFFTFIHTFLILSIFAGFYSCGLGLVLYLSQNYQGRHFLCGLSFYVCSFRRDTGKEGTTFFCFLRRINGRGTWSQMNVMGTCACIAKSGFTKHWGSFEKMRDGGGYIEILQ